MRNVDNVLDVINTIGNRGLLPFVFEKNINYNGFIPLDLKENQGSYLLSADLPGVNKEDISIDFSQDGMLTISVIGREKNEVNESEKVLISERYFMRKERKLNFNTKVDGSAIKAKYENGVLNLELPKIQVKQVQSIVIE